MASCVRNVCAINRENPSILLKVTIDNVGVPFLRHSVVSGNIRYTVYADTRSGSCWRRPQMRVGWLTTAIFGDLSGYFFGHFKDKASNIIWRYANLCWPVTDCKMILCMT